MVSEGNSKPRSKGKDGEGERWRRGKMAKGKDGEGKKCRKASNAHVKPPAGGHSPTMDLMECG